MREVEVKARLRDREAVARKLAELGCAPGASASQDDTVYVKNSDSMDAFLANDFFLRIRETNGAVIFTLKYHPDRTLDVRDASMPEEHELAVSSRSELEAMLALLGFHPALRIYKERQTARLGNREVCLDEVEGLGSFIEIEEFADADDVAAVSASLRQLLAELGVPDEDIGVRRYDVQLLEKRFGTG